MGGEQGAERAEWEDHRVQVGGRLTRPVGFHEGTHGQIFPQWIQHCHGGHREYKAPSDGTLPAGDDRSIEMEKTSGRISSAGQHGASPEKALPVRLLQSSNASRKKSF